MSTLHCHLCNTIVQIPYKPYCIKDYYVERININVPFADNNTLITCVSCYIEDVGFLDEPDN